MSLTTDKESRNKSGEFRFANLQADVARKLKDEEKEVQKKARAEPNL
jgi:hypothetical protein